MEEGANVHAANLVFFQIFSFFFFGTYKFEKREETSLHIAAKKGHHRVISLLLEKGGNIDVVSKEEKVTPVYMASQNGHLEAVRTLLEKDANIHLLTEVFHNSKLFSLPGSEFSFIVWTLSNLDGCLSGISRNCSNVIRKRSEG